MSGLFSRGVPDIERLTVRLTEELETWFVEITCPACHVISARFAIGNLAAQRAFDDLHRHCYVRPFSESSI